MEQLLDFSSEPDVALLDRVVRAFYNGTSSEERKSAELVLKQFQEHPDAWMRVPAVLQSPDADSQAKFLCLQVLDKLVATRWKTLPTDERLGIRDFVVQMCIGWSSSGTVTKSLLNKADLVLVQILKQEWPHSWPTFIPELVAASRSDFGVAENNMVVLKLLSEEVFDFGADKMTSTKAGVLKMQLSSEFGEIMTLCLEVLGSATQPSLVSATLACLQRYLSWVPVQFIFESGNVLELLVDRYLQPEETRNLALKCLIEVAQLATPTYEAIQLQAFSRAIEVLTVIAPMSTNFGQAYAMGTARDQDFIQNLSLYLAAFLGAHSRELESMQPALLQNAAMYLVNISRIEERELFKGCLDYWAKLVLELFDEIKDKAAHEQDGHLRSLFRGGTSGAANPAVWQNYNDLRLHQYAPVLSQLRRVVIEHMVRPEEVLISENEDGEIVRVIYKESDTITLYKSLRDVLVYLTHLDVNDTKNIMLEKLDRQMDGSEWSWHNINVLCWAIGSISGAMDFQLEKHFLSTVLKELLSLTDMTRGKDNKAVVASNIMYIIGQYPRYLRAHWRFLKTVVNKLFEFMHETHEGVQDMACDTFIKIADKCKTHFIEHKPEETRPFIEEIIADIQDNTGDLEPHQIQVFYEACGKILVAQESPATLQRQLAALMELPNMAWHRIVGEWVRDPSQLKYDSMAESVKILGNILKTNTAVCSSLGARFETQLAAIYQDLIGLYVLVSQQIVEDAQSSSQFILTHRARILRSLKRESLRLMETYLRSSELRVAQEIAPSLLTTTLDDYRSVPPQLREYEVLSCVAVVVTKIGNIPENADMVLGIIERVFSATLEMIAGDMTEFPEFRLELFKLLRAINRHCFPVLLRLPNEIFAQTVSACLWASKHDNRDVEDEGLSLTLEIVRNAANMTGTDPVIANSFFQQFARLILGDTFTVLTDPDHRSGFTLQAEILSTFITLVDQNKITAPLYPEGDVEAGTPNSTYLRTYLATSLHNAFPHLQDQQLTAFVEGMFQTYNDMPTFLSHLRDFLVQIKEFGGDDAWLFADERAKQVAEQEVVKRQRDLTVGGLVKPSEIDD